jgi:ribosome-associated toxin RatA of RatAB toxin-antitoxin module
VTAATERVKPVATRCKPAALGIKLRRMSLQGAQEYSTTVAASIQDCFATITDFESYPGWIEAVQETQVLERYPDGLARLVELHVNMIIKTIRYVLQYEYNEPHRLTWRSVEGDIESIEGAYEFEKLAASKIRATCRQIVTVGFWVPGPVRRMIERSAIEQSVLEFKKEAETRARKKAPKRPRKRK